jgi:heme/copper-type cytochrome/quinol oxidase subunit 2
MSSDQISQNLQQRNPITKEAHQRQTFFQIYLPLIIVALLVIFIVVVALLAQNEQASKWADISLIFLISVWLVVSLLVIALTIVAVIYLTRLLKASPYFFFEVQRITFIIEMRSKAIGNSIVEPVLRVNSYIAGARALRRK